MVFSHTPNPDQESSQPPPTEARRLRNKLPPVSGFGSIFKGFQGTLSCCKKGRIGTGHVTNRRNGSFPPLAFALRRFVVDVDAQLRTIRHLQYHPSFNHGSAEIFISLEGPTTQQSDSYTRSLACLPLSVPCLFTYSSHTLKPYMFRKKKGDVQHRVFR